MKIAYFLLALITMPLTASTPMPMSVYVTNNGEIDLEVNGVFIPANPMDTDKYLVHSIKNTLAISVPGDESQHAEVKLLDSDAGITIKIGSHGDAVHVLRSDKNPKLLPFKSNKRFPKKL